MRASLVMQPTLPAVLFVSCNAEFVEWIAEEFSLSISEVSMSHVTEKCCRIANFVQTLDLLTEDFSVIQNNDFSIVFEKVDDFVLMMIDSEVDVHVVADKLVALRQMITFFQGPTLKYGAYEISKQFLPIQCRLEPGYQKNSGYRSRRAAWTLLECMLFTWDFLDLSSDSFKFRSIENVHHFGGANEKPRSDAFLIAACQKVVVESQSATFAVLFSNHKLANVATNGVLFEKENMDPETIRLFEVMIHMLYPTESMMKYARSFNRKPRHESDKEHENENDAESVISSTTGGSLFYSNLPPLGKETTSTTSTSTATSDSNERDRQMSSKKTLTDRENRPSLDSAINFCFGCESSLSGTSDNDSNLDPLEPPSPGAKPIKPQITALEDAGIPDTLTNFAIAQNHIFRVSIPVKVVKCETGLDDGNRLAHFHAIFLKPFNDRDIVLVFGCPAHDHSYTQLSFNFESVIISLGKYVNSLSKAATFPTDPKARGQEVESGFGSLLQQLEEFQEEECGNESPVKQLSELFSQSLLLDAGSDKKLSDSLKCLNAAKHLYEQYFVGSYFGRSSLTCKGFLQHSQSLVKQMRNLRTDFHGVFSLKPEVVKQRLDSTNNWMTNHRHMFPSLVYFLHISKKTGYVFKPRLNPNNKPNAKLLNHIRKAYRVCQLMIANSNVSEVIWRDGHFLYTCQHLIESGKKPAENSRSSGQQSSIDLTQSGEVLNAPMFSRISEDSCVYEMFCVFLSVCKGSVAISWSSSLHRRIWEVFLKNKGNDV